ncbi:MAG: hypothetical protein ACI9EF_003378 [Pseudohongiellaceae bacterium]
MKRVQSQHELLQPGEHCRITEPEWFAVLESVETLHQWGSALLVEQPAGEAALSLPLIGAYWRDDSAAHRHTAWLFDGPTSQHVRDQLEAIEQAAGQVADQLAAAETRGSSTIAELAAQTEASEAYVQLAEGFYRELLRLGASES